MLDPTIMEELRCMAKEGRRPSELIRHIVSREVMIIHVDVLQVYKYFREVFGLSLRDVHLIGGWRLNGKGEVPDTRIDLALRDNINEWVLAETKRLNSKPE